MTFAKKTWFGTWLRSSSNEISGVWESTQRHTGVNTSSVLRKVEEEEAAVAGNQARNYMEIELDLTFSKVRLRSLDWHLR